MNDFYKNIRSMNLRFQKLRVAHSLTSKNVAQHLNTPIRVYKLFEEGRMQPDYFAIARLMKLYGCTSDYLIYGNFESLNKKLQKRLTTPIANKEIGDLEANNVVRR